MAQTPYGKIAEEAKKIIDELGEIKQRAHSLKAKLQDRGDQKSAEALKEELKNNM